MNKECDCCKKKIKHGGECSGKWDGKSCLLFERDPRGKWVREDSWLHLDLGSPIPRVEEEIELVFIGSNIEKKVKIYAINNVRWKKDNKGGLIGISIGLSIGYWSDEGGVVPEKPKLRLVKS